MATYDDYDGVYFSVQAIRLYHPEVTDRTEILVVDNHPSGPCAKPLKDLERHVAGYRYVPYERSQGTAVRDLVFREANAEFVLCMDSHVLFRPGALARLVEYLAAHPDSADLWQGPLLGDDLKIHGTHFDPVWRAGMYGVWATDPRGFDPDAPAFEIPMQGLGVFGCRRAAWPGFNPRLRGFGGEEGYLHEKVRRAGGRTLCLPFLGWTHRFSRPFGPRYAVGVEDRVRNYLLVHDELGLDPGPAIDHFEQEFGAEAVRPLVDRVERELRGPFHFFDAIYCINLDRETGRWESVMRQGKALGIDHRIRRFAAIDTPTCHHIGCALSHRAIVAEAKWLGLKNVLVAGRRRALLAPDRRSAGAEPGRAGRAGVEPAVPGRPSLGPGVPAGAGQPLSPDGPRADLSLHAVAYHHTRVRPASWPTCRPRPRHGALAPDPPAGSTSTMRERFDGMSLVTCPSVATQPSLLPQESPPFEPLA